MSRESYQLDDADPLVRSFLSGLEAWERPFESAEEPKETRPSLAVRTRGSAHVRRTIGPSLLVLPEDDPVLKKFSEGLSVWENPAGTKLIHEDE